MHPLDVPGQADLSADVDFSALRYVCFEICAVKGHNAEYCQGAALVCQLRVRFTPSVPSSYLKIEGEPLTRETKPIHRKQLPDKGVRLRTAAQGWWCTAPSLRRTSWRRWVSVCIILEHVQNCPSCCRRAAEGSSADVVVHGPIPQADLLAALGIGVRLESLLKSCSGHGAAEALTSGYAR